MLSQSNQGSPAKRVYADLADKFGLNPEERGQRHPIGGYKLWDHAIRNTKQTLVKKDLIGGGYDLWALTDKGKDHLMNAKPGVVITVFVTDAGEAIWGDACSVMSSHIEDNSVMLHWSSPPYPLLRQKQYGNVNAQNYIQWILPWAREAYRTLTPDGSLVLNLGEVYQPGEPTLSTYIERLIIAFEDEVGFKLCGRYSWNNPAKLPAPAVWVNIKRIRTKGSVEPCLWFGKTAYPKACNSNVLVPYSDSQKKLIETGWKKQQRPSGHQLTGNFAKNNGGAIPGNVLTHSNTAVDGYIRLCKENGLQPHPARAPIDLVKWFIRFLTDKDDLVADFFGGSAVTGKAAEELGRRWIVGDMSLHYLRTALFRFPDARVNRDLLDTVFAG
jgi:site-specific DNA-methyltransferase (cytosine-N4-specific)